jgi:hypothetical protein
VPSKCKQQRQAYESLCKTSWVKHFDQQQDKKLRLLQTLQGNINKSSASAVGSLAGEAQGDGKQHSQN